MMLRRIPRISLMLIACALTAFGAHAQTCTTATCTAASASEAAVLAALPSSSNTNATVVVNIPAGTFGWTTDLIYTIPSAVTNLTIQGASTVTFTGTAGTSSYNYTAVDNTVIQDADPNTNALMQFNTGASTTKFRITGLTLAVTTGANKFGNGEVYVVGNTSNFRFDHNHITGTVKTNIWLRLAGHVLGVIDHNAGDENPNNGNGDNYYQVFSTADDNVGGNYGDGAWINGPNFGSLAQVYIESNYFHGGAGNDCVLGGRFVARYNTFDSMYLALQGHGTKSSGGAQRACLSFEAYHNYLTGSTSSPGSGAIGNKGGTALIWGNTMANGWYRFYEASTDRNGGDNANETNNPQGWGYCGTATPVPSTGGANGVGSNWDGNTDATGYPCLDGLGRGQDTQELNGQWFVPVTSTGRLNTVTGTIAWPHQYRIPIYMWNNSLYAGATYALVSTNANNNRDYYYDQTAQSGSFTGAAGTGHGLLSARPSACTAGPGGTYGASPTGSYGVAYFATDANSGNGELYVCTATNTWTGIYQPAVMPHPLVSGATPLTSTTTTLTAASTSPVAGVNDLLTATVASSSATGTVTFFDGGTSIGTGTLSSGTATRTVTAITAGTHTYTATYGGDSTFATSTSSTVTVTATNPVLPSPRNFSGKMVLQ